MTQTATGRRPLVFGEVLFDCFPDGSRVLGGAPFNVAWHLHALGHAPLLVSRVGADDAGDEVLRAMRDWQMDVAGVQRDPNHPTGRVVVTLEGSQPSYEILPDQAYDHVAPTAGSPSVALVYHGTLALRQPDSRRALDRICASSGAPVFVDVNLRDPWWTEGAVGELLDAARWCKVNDHELAALAGPGDPLAAARRLVADHDLAQVFVTLGAAGAFSLTADGQLANVAPDAKDAVVDTVGAGDAFAAVLIAGLLNAWPLPVTLQRAQQLASAVCGRRGAVPSEQALYRSLLRQWRDR
jgi:fructokinase